MQAEGAGQPGQLRRRDRPRELQERCLQPVRRRPALRRVVRSAGVGPGAPALRLPGRLPLPEPRGRPREIGPSRRVRRRRESRAHGGGRGVGVQLAEHAGGGPVHDRRRGGVVQDVRAGGDHVGLAVAGEPHEPLDGRVRHDRIRVRGQRQQPPRRVRGAEPHRRHDGLLPGAGVRGAERRMHHGGRHRHARRREVAQRPNRPGGHRRVRGQRFEHGHGLGPAADREREQRGHAGDPRRGRVGGQTRKRRLRLRHEAARQQGSLGLEPQPVAGAGDQRDEFRHARPPRVGHGADLRARGREPGDEAHVGAAPGERAVAPAGGIEMAGRVHVDVGRPRDAQEILLRRRDARAPLGDGMAIDLPPAPVAGEGGVVERPGHPRLVDPAAAGARAAAVVGQRRHDLVGEVDEAAGIAVVLQAGEGVEPHVPAAAVVAVVAGDHVEERAHGRLERVAGAAGEEVEPRTVGPEPHEPAAAQPQGPPVGAHRLHEAEVADRGVDPAVDAEGQAVGRVVRRPELVVEGDAANHRPAVVRHAVAIGVAKPAHVRRVEHDQPVVHPDEPARAVDVGRERLHLVGRAVAVGVAEPEDPATAGIAAERAVAVAGDEERAVGRGGDEHGIVRLGGRREDRRRKARGRLELPQERRGLPAAGLGGRGRVRGPRWRRRLRLAGLGERSRRTGGQHRDQASRRHPPQHRHALPPPEIVAAVADHHTPPARAGRRGHRPTCSSMWRTAGSSGSISSARSRVARARSRSPRS